MLVGAPVLTLVTTMPDKQQGTSGELLDGSEVSYGQTRGHSAIDSGARPSENGS